MASICGFDFHANYQHMHKRAPLSFPWSIKSGQYIGCCFHLFFCISLILLLTVPTNSVEFLNAYEYFYSLINNVNNNIARTHLRSENFQTRRELRVTHLTDNAGCHRFPNAGTQQLHQYDILRYKHSQVHGSLYFCRQCFVLVTTLGIRLITKKNVSNL